MNEDHDALARWLKIHLEQDIVEEIAAQHHLDRLQAMDAYYCSRLAEAIDKGVFGIQNLDARYLARDLVDNEPELEALVRVEPTQHLAALGGSDLDAEAAPRRHRSP